MRDYQKKLLLILVVAVLFILAEGVSRIFFDPTDYLWRRFQPDDVLRHRVEPNTRGHDSWGFRNKSVPAQADIVAIGDSQTYGTSALAKHSWPSVLGKITGLNVYNMSLGGYGPAEYLYLMEHKALGLNPDFIISGFYLGNDIADSLKAVYNVSVWEDLRDPEIALALKGQGLDIDKTEQNKFPQVTILRRLSLIADWFSGHSVLYRIITSSSIGDYLRQKKIISMGEEVEMFEDDEHGIYTGFIAKKWLEGLDLNNSQVREGLKLSLEFYNQMNKLAEKNGIGFLVVIIPLKESVYADFIEHNDSLESTREIDLLIEYERVVNSIVKSYFAKHGISYLDLLEPLRYSAKTEQIYPRNYSAHPNKNGYGIMAQTIKRYLDTAQ